MNKKAWLKLSAFKLHTKATILISIILLIIFAIATYFADLSLSQLSYNEEERQAQLLAARVADTTEHYIEKGRQRKAETLNNSQPPSVQPDWQDVKDELASTMVKNNQEIIEVRVFYLTQNNQFSEVVRIPSEAAPSPVINRQPSSSPHEYADIIMERHEGPNRLLDVEAGLEILYDSQLVQVGFVRVWLSFDQSNNAVSRHRKLVWPLMLLAIVAVTFIIYFLFRQIVYEPLDKLLAAMTKAEAGNLTIEVPPTSRDEIGMLTQRFNRMLGRIREMTEQLNLEQQHLEARVKASTTELAERNEQLEEAHLNLYEMQREVVKLERLATAGQLAAQFAHEVGTPLNLISGHVQLLRARTTDERIAKRLDVIGEQIERITAIVRSMLASTRRPKPNLELIDINQMVAQILDATQPTLTLRNVKLQMRLSPSPVYVQADTDQLQQVFINLINNNLDAMPQGGDLSVAVHSDETQAVIIVTDSGEGIPREYLDVIFDPMFTTKKGHGTGLGLTISKEIIAEHNGDIKVESEVGVGTSFFVILPMARIEQMVSSS
ncbi:MAG: ATP-binding protein [Acidobacteriota bacterium]